MYFIQTGQPIINAELVQSIKINADNGTIDFYFKDKEIVSWIFDFTCSDMDLYNRGIYLQEIIEKQISKNDGSRDKRKLSGLITKTNFLLTELQPIAQIFKREFLNQNNENENIHS